MEYNVKNFKDLLLAENALHNLVSRRSIEQELDKHIEDSLILQKDVKWEGNKVIDIGSGAGFPGLVLAMAFPSAQFTLLEADLKKSSFLLKVSGQLKLENVEVLRRRAEEIGREPGFRKTFDICTARAVASMSVLLEYGLPLIRMGGRLLLWKGRNYQEEIDAAGRALQILGGNLIQVIPYNLLEERDRAIVIIEKNQATPEKYPRRVGVPSKRPL